MKLIKAIFEIITVAAGVAFVLAWCAMDSATETAILTMALSGFWIGGYVYTCHAMREDEEEDSQYFWDN